MWLGVIDFSEKHANIGTLFWATVCPRDWVPEGSNHPDIDVFKLPAGGSSDYS